MEGRGPGSASVSASVARSLDARGATVDHESACAVRDMLSDGGSVLVLGHGVGDHAGRRDHGPDAEQGSGHPSTTGDLGGPTERHGGGHDTRQARLHVQVQRITSGVCYELDDRRNKDYGGAGQGDFNER